MHFGSKSQILRKNQYYINNVPLDTTESHECLGVIITPELNFNQHINQKCATAKFNVNQIMKCFTYKSEFLIKKVYTSIIRPSLEYASLIWKPSSMSQLKQLERVQRVSTKFGKLSNLSYAERCSKLGLNTFQQRLARSDLIQFYRCQNGLFNLNLNQFPKLMDKRTRGAHKFSIIKAAHYARKNFFMNRVVSSWNKLPNLGLKAVTSEQEFKQFVDNISSIASL
jgi:hypothetical protein